MMDFPFFTHNPDTVYLDSAASTQKPAAVINAVSSFVEENYSNIHRGLYPTSIKATEKYENVRSQVAKFINASSPREIIFTKGATEALNALAFTLSSGWKAGDEVILTVAEHHANLIPWQQAAFRQGLTLKFANLDPNGRVDLSHFSSLISPKTKAVSLTHCSNVLGTFNPIPEIKNILRQQGSDALVIVDASQSVSHLPLNVKQLDCDFLVFSGHKMYAPSGTGIWWGREELLASLPPYQTGGDMVTSASLTSAEWNDLPWKFEAGTPNIEGIIGLGEAIAYLTKIGMEKVSDHTSTISSYALDKLSALLVNILGKPDAASGIISFTLEGVHPHDLADALGKKNICIRAGHHCAAPLHKYLGIPASNRLSLGLYNKKEDIDRLIAEIQIIISDYANA